MGTKKLWSVNGGAVWHRNKTKIYLPIDNEKTYTVIFSEYDGFTPNSIDVVIDSSQKQSINVSYSNQMTGQMKNISFSGLNDSDTSINASLIIDGIKDNVNI